MPGTRRAQVSNPKEYPIIKGIGPPGTCVFCGELNEDPDASNMDDDNTKNNADLLCGEMKKHRGLRVHYLCMMFASGLHQTGNMDGALAGFLIPDIQKQLPNYSRVVCSYCGQTGASVECCIPDCPIRYHLPCGRRSGSFQSFIDMDFKSYCHDHCPKTAAMRRFGTNAQFRQWLSNPANAESIQCIICTEGYENIRHVVVGTCCPRAVFHFWCIQGYASSACSYRFSCPYCRNSGELEKQEKFRQEMLQGGIYLQVKEALWEDNGNFDDIYVRSGCVMAVCECPRGRDYSAPSGRFTLRYCETCGAKGIHDECFKIQEGSPIDWVQGEREFICDECETLNQRLGNGPDVEQLMDQDYQDKDYLHDGAQGSENLDASGSPIRTDFRTGETSGAIPASPIDSDIEFLEYPDIELLDDRIGPTIAASASVRPKKFMDVVELSDNDDGPSTSGLSSRPTNITQSIDLVCIDDDDDIVVVEEKLVNVRKQKKDISKADELEKLAKENMSLLEQQCFKLLSRMGNTKAVCQMCNGVLGRVSISMKQITLAVEHVKKCNGVPQDLKSDDEHLIIALKQCYGSGSK